MSHVEEANEHTQLLDPRIAELRVRKQSGQAHEEATSTVSSHVSKEEQKLAGTAIGERLPYNDYTTIDWLHDLVKDSFRHRAIKSRTSLKGRFLAGWDSCQGWGAASMIGIFTALVAFCVDVAAATISDYKVGYCSSNLFQSREACCTKSSPLRIREEVDEYCAKWKMWPENYWWGFGTYIGFALLFGAIAGGVTMTTKANLPAVQKHDEDAQAGSKPLGKSMYMAAGSGIPELKTILSGFVIPHFLDFKVLFVKAVGATFAVSTSLCLGKEGPFVHISACAGYLVASIFPKYRQNGRKMREMLSVACSSGLSVAFGAPIGGVLFSYEEISTYFPRKVLWQAFVCSLFAAIVLKALNPTGTGKLVLFETNYGIDYDPTHDPTHYLVFIFLGISGGLFGGVFCQANFLWSKTFRKYSLIKDHPVFELSLVVLVTALLQFPNPLTREAGDVILKNLLVDCRHPEGSWVCHQEALEDKGRYYGWLVYGTAVKLILTIVTFGCKVPSGIIIPALDAGALFGRLIGQFIPTSSPGMFAMVGAAAFLAGVSRMTVSLAVLMFELTGEVNYIAPFMITIMVAKWTADALSSEGVYDLAQTVLGHPFLDPEHALSIVRDKGLLVEELIPPSQTMREITLDVGPEYKVSKSLLAIKLSQLKARGLMDAGLVLVDSNRMLHGYLAQGELDFTINEAGVLVDNEPADLLEGIVSTFVDRTPLTICAKAPMEYAVELFGKLGLRYLIIVEEGSSKVVGVIIKKRLVVFLESLAH